MEHLYDFIAFSGKQLNNRISQLEDSLTAFSRITETPVSFFTDSGKYQWSTMPDKRLCNANLAYGKDGAPCTRNILAAMNTSLSLSDPYIFMCEAGLIHLCYALVIRGRTYGFLMAGPIAMGNNMDKMIGSFFRKTPAESLDYTCLVSLLRGMKLYKPREIAYLSTLFQNSVAAPLELYRADDIRHQQSREQAGISSKMLHLKKEQLLIEYPRQSEDRLIELIKAGDSSACRKHFSKYVEDIMVFEGGNLPITKLRLIFFFTQLLKNEDAWQRNYDNLFAMEKINEAQTLKELVQTGKSLVTSLAQSVSDSIYAGSSSVIKQLILFLCEHYSETITLKSAAETIHVNPTYLSTLFKQETGVPFVTFLNDLRLTHAEEYLLTTSLSVTEIALQTGFSSSSYFTKLFRKKRGITPKEFRGRPR